MARRVVVVGGGVSGLAVATRLIHHDPAVDVVVLEAADRPGGKLTNVVVGGLDLPAGADAFVARKPWAVDLCRELGLDLVAPAASGAWLWTRTGLVPYADDTAFGIPGDPGAVLRWPGLSGRGRRRALWDLLRRTRTDPGDETLGALLRRRLGDEATDRAVGPLLAGLYAGDVDRLSVDATFPELRGWELAQGSLIRGAQAARRHARGDEATPMFLRPRDGTRALPAALAARLGDRVRTGARAVALRASSSGGGWLVDVDGPTGAVAGDAVVLAVPAAQARELLEPVARAAAGELAHLRAVSTGVVALVYPEGTADALPDGSGVVVPRGEAPFTAVTWLSNKWPDPAYGSRAVLRCFVGADGDEDVLDAADDDIVDACARHLSAIHPLPDPDHAAVIRWPGSMPQPELGHLERVARIRGRLPAGVAVTGQPYDGVGVPDCVRAAGEAATAALDHLRSAT